MFRPILKMAFGVAAVSLSVAVHAAAVFESITGDVRVVAGGQKPAAVKQGQRVTPGSTVITGTNGLAVLKFDDEQKVAVAPNSELAIVDYNYNPKLAAADRSELALNRGAARVVTGQIGRRNYEMFVLRTPHVNLGVRGTDFSVTIIGQSYWSVNEGAVAGTTNVGTGVYGKGSYGRAQSLDRLAAGVSGAGLPVAVLALFNELNGPQVSAQLGSGVVAGPGPSTAPEQGTKAKAPEGIGISAGTLAVLGAIVAVLAAAGGGGSSGGSGGGAPAVVTPTAH